jgi:hypothetical protein
LVTLVERIKESKGEKKDGRQKKQENIERKKL